MSNTYRAMTEKHQAEVNKFPMFFAFSNGQFEEGMKKLGLEPSETDKIYSLGGGGYYRKTDADTFKKMINNHDEEMKKAIETDDDFIFDMFNYELGNHEYCYTRDTTDTIESLGLTMEEINNNERLLKGLSKAIKSQREE